MPFSYNKELLKYKIWNSWVQKLVHRDLTCMTWVLNNNCYLRCMGGCSSCSFSRELATLASWDVSWNTLWNLDFFHIINRPMMSVCVNVKKIPVCLSPVRKDTWSVCHLWSVWCRYVPKYFYPNKTYYCYLYTYLLCTVLCVCSSLASCGGRCTPPHPQHKCKAG